MVRLPRPELSHGFHLVLAHERHRPFRLAAEQSQLDEGEGEPLATTVNFRASAVTAETREAKSPAGYGRHSGYITPPEYWNNLEDSFTAPSLRLPPGE